MPNLRPGVQTSEFWLTAATTIVSLLAAAGIIGSTDAPAVTENFKTAVLGGFALSSLLSYVWGRVSLKKDN